jgi:RHS repeat-associated protein
MRGIRAVARVVAVSIVSTLLVSVTSSTSASVRDRTEDAPSGPAYQVHETLDTPTDHSDPAWASPAVALPPATVVDVDLPATGWARAGTLPVSLARPFSGAAPARVRVRMLSQDEVAAIGGRLLGFELTRADGGPAVGAVDVSLDYSSIAQAFGGDFASRMRLVRTGDCAVAASCAHASVGATRDATPGRLRAKSVPVRPAATTGGAPAPDSGFGPQLSDPGAMSLSPSTATTFTVASAASGSNGDYTASQLAGSEKWSVGVGSGGFTYSYPITVPPAVAGPAPTLSIDYSSQSVDGRTLAANGQVSKVGEGWSFEPGFIERRFHSCRSEGLARDDLCWSSDNEYFLHFMGMSGELVRKGTTNEWRLRNDPAWRILSFNNGGGTGDNDGEYFVVITPDGTKYWFGYGSEPRNTPTRWTNSVFEVPVYGGSGEPCYSTVTSSSWCRQAYRWNVDRILDTNDNVTSLFYAKEYNNYARQSTTTLPTQYVRSGYLTEIEYGQRHLAEDGVAYARVRVNTMDRCYSQSSCSAPSPSSTQSSYPDVPLDLMCTSSVSCGSDQTAPTFWSTKEITSIQTEYWNAAASPPVYHPVSTYLMTYSFPATGDGTTPSLWLKDITRRGDYGAGSITLPGVRMSGTNLPNRVNTGAGVPALSKWRVGGISTELGAHIDVTYGRPDPCPLDTIVAWDTNPYDCYPVWYDPNDGFSDPGWVAFHKYVVTGLVTADVRGGGVDRTLHYTYVGSPAWHYGDSALAKPGSDTWNDYRGYSEVRVAVDGTGASEDSETRYLLFRGMYGDKLLNGTSKSVQLTDSSGAEFNDFDFRTGLTLESKSYDAADGHFASKLYRYWALETVDGPNGFQSHDADYVRTSKTIDRVRSLNTGAWRDHVVEMTYLSSTGVLWTTSDEQMPGDSTDDTCTKLSYTENTTTGTAGGDTEWVVDAPNRTWTFAGACGSGSTSVLAKTEYDYDGQPFQSVPNDANVTQTRAFVEGADAAVTKTQYDSLGRVTSTTSPNEVANGTNGKMTIAYSPSAGYPYLGVTTTNVLGQTSSTIPYSAFGTPRRITDANGDETNIAVDNLGRTTSVSRPYDPSGAPGVVYEYHVELNTPNTITTRRLLTGTTYVTSVDYVDGLGRTIQTQLPAPDGVTTDRRRIVLTRYDQLGRQSAVSQPFDWAGAPGSDLPVVGLTQIPFETRYGYDSASRVYAQTRYATGVSQFTTRTTYLGWMHVVDSPVRSDVDYHTDYAGRTTKIVENSGTGITNTDYEYTPLGDIAKITDDAANVTTYSYDMLRRRTVSTDPDQGTWRTSYDGEGHVTSVQDAKLDSVTYAYDRLGRKVSARSGTTASGPLLAEWRYDTATGGAAVANGTGRLTVSTSYAAGAAYTTAVTAYDDRGRVTGRRFDVPTAAGALARSYAYTYGYDLSDNLVTTSFPAVAGLGAETVTAARNDAGLPSTVTSSLDVTHPYVVSTQYRTDGKVAARDLAHSVHRTYTYDASAGRLATMRATAPLWAGGSAVTIENIAYGYDDESNVVSVADYLAGESGTAQSECFRYDGLNRLTSAFTTGSACSPTATPATFGTDPYSATYTYDDIDNLRSMSTGSTTSNYVYTGSGHAHAPATVGGSAYAYDANGATTTRPSTGGAQTLTWNKLHQLASVSGPGASTFVYDADGNRLVRTTGTTATLYLEGMEIKASGTTSVAATRYYGNVAMRTSGGVSVLLHNQQNSTTTVFAGVGTTPSRQRYLPFGGLRGSAALTQTERRFLDKTEDPTGLVSMGARYYDAGIGQFASVDPILDPGRPRTLNPYAYALNNPTSLSDPSGLNVPGYEGGPCTSNCPGSEPDPDPLPAVAASPSASGGGAGPGVASTPAVTVMASPSPVPDSGGGPFGLIKSAAKFYDKVLPYLPYGQEVQKIYHDTLRCGGSDNIGQCGPLWFDLFIMGMSFAPAVKGLGVVRAGEATGGAASSANAARLAGQLSEQEAGAVFTSSGTLQPEVIADSTKIINGTRLGNDAVVKSLTADGSNIADWGKYTTRSFESPSGPFQVHFYQDSLTGRVFYDLDYKAVFVGGG